MIELPTLSQVRSPNYSSRGGARVRVIVVHDCEGSYSGSVAWFATAKSEVSAHLVLSEDGARATQMVDWRNKAWHAMNYNGVSEGIEAAGFAAKGLGAAEWQALANITAFRLRANALPCRWAVGGVGEGYCQHVDLGVWGGGHHDITSDARVWGEFQNLVATAYAGDMPMVWAGAGIVTTPPIMPAGFAPVASPRHDIAPPSLEWVQLKLNALGFARLQVDGMMGRETGAAVRAFQEHAHIAIDGDPGPQTIAALQKAAA